MDILTLAQLNKLKANGGVGYTSGTPDTLVWDGNTEGRESAMGQVFKVSDVVPTMADLANGATITGDSVSEGVFELTVQSTDIQGTEGMIVIGPVYIFSETDDTLGITPGVFFSKIDEGGEDDFFVTKLVIPGYKGFETIHPIEPKFIPGAVLPVVELPADGTITESMNKQLTAAIGSPAIFICPGVFSEVGMYMNDEGTHQFILLVSQNVIVSDDGVTWQLAK